MKTLVLLGLCTGVIATSAVAEGEGPRQERKGPEAGRDVRKGDRERGDRDRRHGRPPFGPGGEMFRKLDTDGDGNISKQEFFAGPRIKRLPEEKREKIFTRLDGDGDGVISRAEIREMRKDAEKRAEREFRALDKDGSGGLSFEEFSGGRFFAKLPEDKRRQIFERMDTDGDGVITPEDRPQGPPKKNRRPGD